MPIIANILSKSRNSTVTPSERSDEESPSQETKPIETNKTMKNRIAQKEILHLIKLEIRI